MRRYEGMFILKPDMATEDHEKTVKSIEEAISKNGGKVEKCEKWARRRLAYSIKKYAEGEYYLCDFTVEPKAITPLNMAYGLNENILRTMIIVKE
ncbi:MAG: 30S ribosomal protein S6 [Candidatus Omnitrophica bacterium]|nr:30S ribosomal protein S6 [Candidatus Omnitrophota bacterium]